MIEITEGFLEGTMDKTIKQLVSLVETSLLTQVMIQSESDYDPVEVTNKTKEWVLIGKGNYAGVFTHENYPEFVVKVYGRDVYGVKKEAQVYRKLGVHPAYSQLFHEGKTYLILKRLTGVTLYDAIQRGIKIPEQVIKDVNAALDYATSQGLNPYDVHGKNVMMKDGRGYVVDISDFYKEGFDKKWTDLVKAYYTFYPFIDKYHIRLPYPLLNVIRKAYRLYRRIKSKRSFR